MSEGTDTDARWIKFGKTIFGFKCNDGVDENTIVQGVNAATASEHDSKGF